MGTTKLTRKEILAEDPVHQAIIRLLDFLRTRGIVVAIAGVSAVVLAVGVYFLLQYLESRDQQAQRHIAKAMNFYHAQIDQAALDDPFGKGPEPLFRNETAKYQAAGREFQAFLDTHRYSKLSVLARYYLGLCQLQLGQEKEALQSLEQVKNNSKDRTLSYLAKRVLAKQHAEAGNLRAAEELLAGMIQDPQCELPKDDLKLELAKLYAAQGKRDQALKILREARDEAGRSRLLGSILRELARVEGTPSLQPGTVAPVSPRP